MSDPLKVPKLPRGRLGPTYVEGEALPIDEQPVRRISGGMAVVVDPTQGNQITRDRRNLGPGEYVPMTTGDRLLEGLAFHSPVGQLVEGYRLSQDRGPTPGSAPQSVPLPPPEAPRLPPTAPELANILEAVQAGHATPAQGLGAAELVNSTTPVDMAAFVEALRAARARSEMQQRLEARTARRQGR